jgi:hypothetical protein
MRTLAPPDPKLWQARADWFWRAHDINAGPHVLDLGARSGMLLAELETLFCAGAWASVVIVAWTLVEAEQRTMARALAARGEDTPREPDADWLRERRNALVHVDPDRAANEVPDEAALEAMAQGAVRVAFKTLFAAAWR